MSKEQFVNMLDRVACRRMLEKLSAAQKVKLDQARGRGAGEWWSCPIERLEELLLAAAKDDDWVSVANYAGMLEMLQEQDEIISPTNPFGTPHSSVNVTYPDGDEE